MGGGGAAHVAEGLTSEMSAEGLRFQKGPLGGFTGKPKACQLGVSGPPAASGMFVNPGKERSLASPFHHVLDSPPSPFPSHRERWSLSVSAPRRKTVTRAFPGPRGGSFGTLISLRLPLGHLLDLLGMCGGRELASATPLLGLQTLKPLKGTVLKCPSRSACQR